MYHKDALRALRDAGAVAEICGLLREMQDEGAVMKPAYFRIALQACSVQGPILSGTYRICFCHDNPCGTC